MMNLLPDDPRIANLPRHLRLDELLSNSSDPAPRKTRRVEWIGEENIMEDPRIQANLLLKRYSKTQERAIMMASARANTRGHRHRTRLLEHNHAAAQAVVMGLKRTYIFSELNGYTQFVDFGDYDAIFASGMAHEFIDLDDEEMVAKRTRIKRLDKEVFHLVAQETYKRDDERITARTEKVRGTIVATA